MKSPYCVVKTLMLSEKVSRGIEADNRYCVLVDRSSNKLEIKKAVEELFNVHVVKINTLNRRGKRKRERARTYGRTSATKRAMVTLKEGDKIDIA